MLSQFALFRFSQPLIVRSHFVIKTKSLPSSNCWFQFHLHKYSVCCNTAQVPWILCFVQFIYTKILPRKIHNIGDDCLSKSQANTCGAPSADFIASHLNCDRRVLSMYSYACWLYAGIQNNATIDAKRGLLKYPFSTTISISVKYFEIKLSRVSNSLLYQLLHNRF